MNKSLGTWLGLVFLVVCIVGLVWTMGGKMLGDETAKNQTVIKAQTVPTPQSLIKP